MWPRVSKDGFDINALLSGKWTSIRVEDETSIGAGCVILPGVLIGKGCTIAAGSRVDRSVPDYCLLKPSGEVVKLAPRIPDRMREAV
jgi:acetyltransferase-like isoleucine patch superfamily enzyme